MSDDEVTESVAHMIYRGRLRICTAIGLGGGSQAKPARAVASDRIAADREMENLPFKGNAFRFESRRYRFVLAARWRPLRTDGDYRLVPEHEARSVVGRMAQTLARSEEERAALHGAAAHLSSVRDDPVGAVALLRTPPIYQIVVGQAPVSSSMTPSRVVKLREKKPVPCNLSFLEITAAPTESSGCKSVRNGQVRLNQALKRNQSPSLLKNGQVFQITANSSANEPREVTITVHSEASCGADTHPRLDWSDSEESGLTHKTVRKLKFFREPQPGDTARIGLFAMWNAAFSHESTTHAIVASSCGVPAASGGAAVASLGAVIEVFPADQYTAEISLPAFLKPDALEYSKSSQNWTSARDKDKEKIEEAKKLGSEVYEGDAKFMKEAGISRKDIRDFAEEQEKRRIGYLAEDPPGLKIEISQQDGNRLLKASVDEILNLCRLVRESEYRFKQLQLWFEKLQWGPGVGFKIECQFLILKLSAKWGYKEYTDDRVFLEYGGSLDLDILKAEAKISAGVRFAGMADAIVFISGEGVLGLTVPEIKKEKPDETVRAHVKPRGELKFSGGVEGTLMWVVQAKGSVSVPFSAETEDLEVFTERGVISGTVVVKREAVVLRYDLSMAGAFSMGGKSDDLVKEDKWSFPFPPQPVS